MSKTSSIFDKDMNKHLSNLFLHYSIICLDQHTLSELSIWSRVRKY